MSKCAVAALLAVASLPAAATVLFNGDFESATAVGNASLTVGSPTSMADYDRSFTCNQAWQTKIVNNPARQGRNALRLFLDEGLPSRLASDITRNKERCMINMRRYESDGGAGKYGQTRYYAWSIYVPNNAEFEAADAWFAPAAWECVTQIMHNDSNSVGVGNFHMLVEQANLGGRWKAEIYGGAVAIPVRYVWGTNIMSTGRGKWHDFLLKYKFSRVAGQAETTMKYRAGGGAWATAFSNTSAGNVKDSDIPDGQQQFSWDIGLYRGAAETGAQALYFDGPRVATTEAEAEAFFAVAGGSVTIPAPSNISYTPD